LAIEGTSQKQISEEIVGLSKTKKISRKKTKAGSVKLNLSNLDILGMPQIGNALNLEVKASEIVGIAGVAGNGQSELVEAIVGLRSSKSGLIEICNTDVTGANISTRRDVGLCYIPEDRQKRGLALDAQLSENASISSLVSKAFANGPFLRKTKIREFTEDLIKKFEVKAASPSALANSLSGGNKQKLIIARELSLESDVIIAENPTWGVDLGAINQIHHELLSMRQNGHAILLVSSDLDEILALSDRVLVMFESELSQSFWTEKVTREDLGKLMLMKASDKKEKKKISSA
jgi:simple sugar transport system ATP-binding protein